MAEARHPVAGHDPWHRDALGRPLGSSPEERLAAFLDACGGAVRQTGEETVCHCPAHDDEIPSLNVRIGESGKLLIKCRAACTTEAVVEAIGWTLKDLMPPSKHGRARRSDSKTKKSRYDTIEAISDAAATWKNGSFESKHVYRDAENVPVFAVVRVRRPDGSKEIPQIRPASGGWMFGGIKKHRPLYRLPELLAASGEVPVLLFEGEQKADLAARLGFVATSCSQGAGNAHLTDFAPLAGRTLTLFPDNDPAGTKHMRDVAARAYAARAVSVSIAQLPDLPAKGDIVDFCDARHEAGAGDDEIAEEIREAIASAANAEAEPDDGQADPDEASTEDAPDDSPDNIADRLVGLANDTVLFHDEQDDAYATIRVDEHRETWRIGSEHFERWLRSQDLPHLPEGCAASADDDRGRSAESHRTIRR